MAWYYGKFSCGHEGRVNIIGPVKDRQWKANNKFSGMCPECYKEYLEKQREEANKKALEQSKEMELPQLIGTEKQIAWATTLRVQFIEKITRIADEREKDYSVYHEGKHSKKAKRYIETLDYIIETETSAKFFIDNRNRYAEDIIDQYKEQYKNEFKKTIDDVQKEEIEKECTVKPIEVKHCGIVKIDFNSKDKKITAEYEKNDDFRSIVKSLSLKWNNGWYRNINELTGSYIDRMAELGNKLLQAGFIVSIMDREAKEKAISGTYEEECDRWIKYNADNNKLEIKWYVKNDNLYNSSRKLTGSKWDSDKKATVVGIEHFEEVEEFAEMYNFKYTIEAAKKIEEYRKSIEGLTTVEVVAKDNNPDKDGLNEILNSSREILDDLKED